MEILGDDDTSATWNRRADTDDRKDPALDLDLTSEDDVHAATPTTREPGVLRRSLEAVGSAEAFGTAGVLIAILTIAAVPLLFLMLLAFNEGPPGERVSGIVTMIGIGAALTLALGVAGLLRLPSQPSAFARAVAGASTLLGLLMVAITIWSSSQLDRLPDAF